MFHTSMNLKKEICLSFVGILAFGVSDQERHKSACSVSVNITLSFNGLH